MSGGGITGRGVGAALLVALALLAGAAAPARGQDRVCTETTVPMDDGVQLHAWVSRAAPDAARPVLFMMDSYARSGRENENPEYDNACPEFLPDDYVSEFLSRDLTERFTLVQVSYRGTGASEGLFDMTGTRTQRDLRAALDWAAGQPWSNGDTVVVGESGTAFAGHHALTHPSVRAAALFTSCADMYRCFYRGGQYNALAEVYFAATSAGMLGAGGASPDKVAALGEMSARTKAQGTNDAWWQERSALEALSQARVPVMLTTDLYDIVQPFDALQLLPDVRFNFGMGHLTADTIAAGGDRYAGLVRTPVDRFVAHHGLGEDNGAEDDPRVTLMTNTGSNGTFRDGHVLVRGERDWPLPSTRWTRLELGGGTFAVAPAPGVDMRTDGFIRGRSGPGDMRNAERAGLTFTTPELKRDLEVTGPIALKLLASSTAPDFDWTVRVTDVWPDGRSEWITDGSLRASLRKVDESRSLRDDSGQIVRPWLTFDTPELVPPAAPVEYLVDVIATSNVFRAGHRLRVSLLPTGTTDTPRTGGAGAVTVHEAELSLPVIPGRCQSGKPLVQATERVRCARSYAEAIK